jgi:Gelsolin repeat
MEQLHGDDVYWSSMTCCIHAGVTRVYCNHLFFCAPGAWGSLDSSGSLLLPPTVPLSLEALRADSAYLLDNSSIIVLWLGVSVPPEWLGQLFGLEASHIPAGMQPQLWHRSRNI